MLKSHIVRVAFGIADSMRDAGQRPPKGMTGVHDIPYGSGPWQLMDLYLPQDATLKQCRLKECRAGALPVIINVHGGGWVYGDKEAFKYYCMHLTTHGFAVINFTYGLAPDHKFPTQLTDMNAVVEWVLRNGHTHGLDNSRIFLVGDSAGAHLTALYAGVCAGEDEPLRAYVSPPDGFKPVAVGLNCGVFDIHEAIKPGPFSFRSLLIDLLEDGKECIEKGNGNSLSHVDVISHVGSGFPPTYLMTSSGDFLKKQAFIMRERLVTNGIPHVFRVNESKRRLLLHVFHLDIRMEEARRSAKEMCDYFYKVEGICI